jgi:hypothetical protein
MTEELIAIGSGLVVVGSFVLARYVRNLKGLKHHQRALDGVGVLLALSLLVFVEALMQVTQGTSFFTTAQQGFGDDVAFIFMIGALQGVIYEYVGQFTYPLWYYPAAERHRFLLLGLPLFWGIFMLIMQDTWALYRGWGLSPWLAVPAVALTQYALIEGINLWLHSWKYRGFANTPYFLIPGWVILVLTFVVGYNHFFDSPFGF